MNNITGGEQMKKYIRITKGLVDKGMLVLPEEASKYVGSKKDYYASIYHYNDKHFEQFKKTGSIKGIRDVTTDKYYMDFDDEANPENARKDAIEAIERLKKYGINENDVEVYFSGKKGFAVQVTLNKEITPEEAYFITEQKIGTDLQTLDMSMYDAPQIWRIPGTKHPDGGYKVPLSVSELREKTIDEIKKYAEDIDNVQTEFNWNVVTPSKEFFSIQRVLAKPKETESKEEFQIDWTKKPTKWKKAKWAILHGFFDKGERQEALMVLAATLRAQGFPESVAYDMCKGALDRSHKRFGEGTTTDRELQNNIVGQIYSDGWSGGQYSQETPGWFRDYCIKHNLLEVDREDEDLKPITLMDLKDSFKTYVQNIEKNTILTGIPSLDKNIFISTGANVGVIGAAGSGKSSLALNILNNTSKAGVKSVFASLDMHKNRMFEKVLYKVSGLSREKLYELFKNNEEKELLDKVKEEFGNVNFFTKSSPTVKDIRDYIIKCEQETGEKVKLVMLDYFERVNSDKSEDTAASKQIAGELQDLVNDLDVALVTLVQPNKMGLSGGIAEPIYDYTKIKGSSFVYQSFRIILSLWRPFYTPSSFKDDKFMKMAVLKNDLGELNEFSFAWNGKKGEVSELEQWQLDELDSLMNEKEQAKKSDSNSGWE